MQIPLTVAVTGHRDPRPADVPAIEAAVRGWLIGFQRRFPACPLRLIAPLAEGADRIVARVALELEIELIVLAPFAFVDYEQDFSDPASLGDFHALLERGGTLLELPLLAGFRREDLGDREVRALHYARMGAFLSDHAQILIAVWDGQETGLLGGTGEVVAYHQNGAMAGAGARFSRPVDILAEDSTDLVVHVACARDGSAHRPAWPAGTVRLVTEAGEVPSTAFLPRNYTAMIERISTFNRDLAQGAPGRAPEGWEAVQGGPGGDLQLERTVELFGRADQLASRFRRRFVNAMRATFLLAAAMGLAFIAYGDLDWPAALPAFLVSYAAAFGIYLTARRFQWHRRYLDYRILAEGLRVQFYWRAAGISGRQRNDYAHDSFLLKQDLEVSWIRQVMKAVELPALLEEGGTLSLAHVMDVWLGDGESGQIGYFSARVRALDRKVQVTGWVIRGCVVGGIGLGIALLFAQGRITGSIENALVAAMGLLPLVAGLREAYTQKTAQAELARQYRYMLRLFTDARRKLAGADPDARRVILRALGEAALDEHAQWMLLHRERALDRFQL